MIANDTTKTLKLRGVNLGGWLVLERWMTPSLFEGTTARDEYDLMRQPGAAEMLERHRQTFITERDFEWLVAHGINAVRIPVGYWVLEDASPFVSAVQHLDWAMNMARKYSLQVVIDLHGLKGSQNGNDHSGRVGRSAWFEHEQYRHETLALLERIAMRYRDYENFWGLQIVNEPKKGFLHLKLRRFYREAYRRLSGILHPRTNIIFSDGFTPRLMSGVLGRRAEAAVMDVHLYHMSSGWARFLPAEMYLRIVGRRKRFLGRLSRAQPVVVGEWSGVMRRETMAHVPEARRDELFRRYVRLQQEAYADALGWFYWSYKTESAKDQWNFRAIVEAGLDLEKA